ncbi:hypothetical protein L6R52_26695 [Myxococcota bacterium]|nr:hypothetical protein [Myxococcota bacterium]
MAIGFTSLLALAACKDPPPLYGDPDGGSTGTDASVSTDDGGTTITPDSGVMAQEFPQSSKAALRFKRNDRLQADFAQALGLEPGALCNELGQYSCTHYVHTIGLGGVDPYVLGIREPLDVTTITTPLAVERVALAGCQQRVTQDLANGAGAVIFRDLGVDENGALDPDAPAVAAAIDTLYKRAVLRPARPSEVAHLVQLYRDVEGTNQPGPARDWAILACFSVLTTMEALFY